jgi:hypothetical protein
MIFLPLISENEKRVSDHYSDSDGNTHRRSTAKFRVYDGISHGL